MSRGNRPREIGEKEMLQLILAVSFVGMILIPAIVAAFSGKKETEATHDELEAAEVAAAPIRMAQPVEREVKSTRKVFQAATLPMHRTLGMAGR
jgi:hypothetical protein